DDVQVISQTGDLMVSPGMNFMFSTSASVASLLAGSACPQAAFAEQVRVFARAQDGYSRLSLYDVSDLGAFALTPPPAAP
ncbi:MAG: hypothetical protein AAFY59_05365, partial [Pseudomonadota bacterium]